MLTLIRLFSINKLGLPLLIGAITFGSFMYGRYTLKDKILTKQDSKEVLGKYENYEKQIAQLKEQQAKYEANLVSSNHATDRLLRTSKEINNRVPPNNTKDLTRTYQTILAECARTLQEMAEVADKRTEEVRLLRELLKQAGYKEPTEKSSKTSPK